MNRFIPIDSLRGLLLVIMTVNHLPGPHRAYTYDQIGYFTAAEGFVFISGLVAGLHGYKMLLEKGEAAMRQVFYRRAGLLYGSQMVLLALLFFAGWFTQGISHGLPEPEKSLVGAYAFNWNMTLHPLYTHPMAAWGAALTLLYQPPLFDVLPMYCIFLFFTPFFLCCIQKKRAFLLLGGSLLLWLLAQSQAMTNLLKILPGDWGIHEFVFDPVAWQILFLLGVLTGSFWRLRQATWTPSYSWLIGATALIALGLFIRHAPVSEPAKIFLGEWSYRGTLAPLRLLSTAAILFFIGLWALKFPQVFTWPVLARLGRNSLWVFLYQIALVYVFGFWCERLMQVTDGIWLNLLFITLVTSTLWLASAAADQMKSLIRGDSCWLTDRLFTVPPPEEPSSFRLAIK